MANIVRNVAGAYLSTLDMWTATIVPSGRGTRGGGFGVDADKDADADAETKVRRKFVCFFSLGFDAHISHRFTKRRERDPSSCATVWQNKAWYAYYGAKEFMSGGGHLTGDDGKRIVELYVDDKRVDVPRDLNSVQVFNIHSSADGVDFWGTNRPSVKGELPDSVFVPPCVGDGMLEVVGTRGVSDLVAVRNGFAHSKRLAQGGRVELRLSAPVAAQMDGETWVQSPCVVRIEHAGGIPLCVGPGGTRNLQPGLETTGGGGGCLRL
jgi:diacylglycerol kinase (ATP)